ncbi:hypothetical protein BYT27DRAFT_7262642 [Phlegmacium glaucopus]|nr:hypothetical protein BYT27DRAFT_7262642 [Phlegmacium glaucopus]
MEPDDPKEKKKLDARYYGLLLDVDLEELLDPILVNGSKDFWTKPHVMIIHRGSIDEECKLWDQCTALHDITTTTPTYSTRYQKHSSINTTRRSIIIIIMYSLPTYLWRLHRLGI